MRIDPPVTSATSSRWLDAAILVGRLIFVLVFVMALAFKLMDIQGTAKFISAAGFPIPLTLAWMAVLFEAALVVCLATGLFFRPAALAAGVYVVFLAAAFHGPSKWEGNQMEFGAFIDHFTFLAGLLYAAGHGPGRLLAIKRR